MISEKSSTQTRVISDKSFTHTRVISDKSSTQTRVISEKSGKLVIYTDKSDIREVGEHCIALNFNAVQKS